MNQHMALTDKKETDNSVVIRKLDDVTINRIAAGEIIQRPSAVVKEMLENSLDAGATTITVTAKSGGMAFLQVQDNGHGIKKESLDIVCERFTTSKITKFEDLRTIGTFGFRGEALASISHVAYVTIITKTAKQACAYKSKYVDGRLVPLKPGEKPVPKACAGVTGCTITVEDLFHNMLTRRQAFRSYNDEYQRILDVVTNYAIHFGDREVSFICKKVGSASADLQTSQTSSTKDNIKLVYGASVAKELLDFHVSSEEAERVETKDRYTLFSAPDITDSATASESATLSYVIDGYLSNANYSTRKATCIIFINNRLVDCSSVRRTIESVYAQYLPKHTHPFVYLSIRMPPQHVDVNVHPTKKEVHFLYEEELLEKLHTSTVALLQGANFSRVFYTQTLMPLKELSDVAGETPLRISGKKRAPSAQKGSKIVPEVDSEEDSVDQGNSDLISGDKEIRPGSLSVKTSLPARGRRVLSDESDEESDSQIDCSSFDIEALGDETFFPDDGQSRSGEKTPQPCERKALTLQTSNHDISPVLATGGQDSPEDWGECDDSGDDLNETIIDRKGRIKNGRMTTNKDALSFPEYTNEASDDEEVNELETSSVEEESIESGEEEQQAEVVPPIASVSKKRRLERTTTSAQLAVVPTRTRANTAPVKRAARADNKLVRVDHSDSRIDDYFQRSSGRIHSTQNSLVENISSISASVLPSSSTDEDTAVGHCHECKEEVTSGANKRNEEDTEIFVAPMEVSMESGRQKMARYRRTPFRYASVQSLLDNIPEESHSGLKTILKRHSVVGVLSNTHLLIQHDTRLLLINYSNMAFHMFYQLAISRLGIMPRVVIENPVPVKDFVLCALDLPTAQWSPEDGDKETIATAAVDLLVSKSDILDKYFRISISSEGMLTGIPELLEGYTPSPVSIPVFLLRLATDVVWGSEVERFSGVAKQLALLYSDLDCGMDPVEETSSGNSITPASPETEKLVKGKILPAIRAYLDPPREFLHDGTVVQIAALEQLYKVFERC